MYFGMQFVHKMWPIQLAFLCCLISGMFLFVLTLCNTSLFCTFGPTDFFILSSTTFQNIKIFLICFFGMSKFQHYTGLCSICSISLVSFLSLSPTYWWKKSSCCWMLLLPWKSWIWFNIYILLHLLSGYPEN